MKFIMWIAWHLPARVVYWATIRLIAHATQGQYGNTIVPELTAMDAVDRWARDFEQPPSGRGLRERGLWRLGQKL